MVIAARYVADLLVPVLIFSLLIALDHSSPYEYKQLRKHSSRAIPICR